MKRFGTWSLSKGEGVISSLVIVAVVTYDAIRNPKKVWGWIAGPPHLGQRIWRYIRRYFRVSKHHTGSKIWSDYVKRTAHAGAPVVA